VRLDACKVLRQLLPAHIQRRAQLLPRADGPGLALGLNRGDQRARYLRLSRKRLLSKLPILTPNPQRGLTLQPALRDLQWYKFVLASLKTCLCRIVRLYVGKHFRIFDQPLQVFHNDHNQPAGVP